MKRIICSVVLLVSLVMSQKAIGRNRPVIDFGDDYAWQGGLPVYRAVNPILLHKNSPDGKCPVDVDGDGQADDDSVAYYPFSMDIPLNPTGGYYNDAGNNARFYGGLVSFFANKPPQWSEGGINIDHEGRDDFNLHSYATEGGAIGLQTFGLWLWKKEDFLNGGDQYPVRFDEESRLAVYISRYWKGYDHARFVVRDGEQFYISEASFAGRHTLHIVYPLKTRWAVYNPKAPFYVGFDPAEAEFKEHVFNDVTAAGWWVTKPEVSPGALWLKWYAYGMDAVVDVPEHFGVPEKTPVSYAQWKTVFERAARNQYALHSGYAFANDGSPGLRNGVYSPAAPVSEVSLLDAMVWCNALSEQQGLSPCYYEDPEMRYVLRRSIRRNEEDPPMPAAPVLNKAADGYAVLKFSDEGFVVGQGGGSSLSPTGLSELIPGPRQDVPLPEMVQVPQGTYGRFDEAEVMIAPLFVSKTEINYAQWLKIKRWAEAKGYRFDHAGLPGSMGRDLNEHTGNEPVTEISQLDSMVWCNALSEYEGRTPCYYEDETKLKVLRAVSPLRFDQISVFLVDEPQAGERPHATILADVPYLKWEADGYRLPTHDEWEYAARGGSSNVFPWGEEFSPEQAWVASNSSGGTKTVGMLLPNGFGLYDVIGNVYEWVWGGVTDYYDSDNPRGDGRIIARGGSFRSDGGNQSWNDPRAVAHRPNPALGRLFAGAAYPEIGFRIVRCAANTHPPASPGIVPRVVLDVQPEQIDSLQGAIWRGNTARTGEFFASPPTENPLVKWKFQTGGAVKSSPVAVDGRVFIGSESGTFYALDANSGEVLWSFAGGSPMSTSAMVASGMVFVACQKGLFALDVVTGDERWKQPVNGTDHLVSPLAAGGVVFWQRPWQPLTGMDIQTGEERWKHRDGRGVGRSTSSPAVLGTRLAWCNGSPGSTVAELRTERLLWRYDGAADSHVFTPALRDGGMIVIGQEGVSELDMETGRILWSYSQSHWDTRHPMFSSPAVDAQRAYIGHKDGHIYAVNRADGSEAWKYKTNGQVYSSPAVASGQVVVGSLDGVLRGLNSATGELLWEFETGGPIESSPALYDDLVLIGSDDGFLYCLKK